VYQNRLRWHISVPLAFVGLGVLLVATWLAVTMLEPLILREEEEDLLLWARLIAADSGLVAALEEGRPVEPHLRAVPAPVPTPVMVLSRGGKELATLGDIPVSLVSRRAEVVLALQGEPGSSLEHGREQRNSEVLSVAVPVRADGRVVGAVWTSASLQPVRQALGRLYLYVGLVALLVVAVAVLLSHSIAERLALPLGVLRRGAQQFAAGDLRTPIPLSETGEFYSLASTMNRMAGQLDERLNHMVQQRNELEAVLSSMGEGVIAVDLDERLIILNRAAAQIFEVEQRDALGRTIQEIIRNRELQEYMSRVLQSGQHVEGEIQLFRDGLHYLHVHGTVLRDANGAAIGGLVVLNDVTALRQLEQARSEFVANVSHEVRTPITSIIGYAETLLETDDVDRETLQRFLGIIARQAARLNSIVTDLLALSRLEQEVDRGEIELERVSLQEPVKAAVQVCRDKANAKAITLDWVCPPELTADLNPPLFEQAVVNLIDNAIKYSDPGTEVFVEGAAEEGHLRVAVHDQGCGISKDHLPRLFERFYRVDKARSRAQGGTGLGLAIVKHIVRLHGGEIDVESHPGKGSVFAILLPGADGGIVRAESARLEEAERTLTNP
jgi:two-component system phosphate regulon sensor histidine kinase PhoR